MTREIESVAGTDQWREVANRVLRTTRAIGLNLRGF